MKKILLMLLITLCLTQFVLASSVTRSFSDTNLIPGDILTVTLDVVVDDGSTYYLIDELYPSTSWVIIDNGGGTSELGHIRWAVIMGATSTTYQYDLIVPDEAGIHDFLGTYGFEFISETDILGETQVAIPGLDTTPPEIRDINVVPSQTSAEVTWETDEDSDSIVYYGLTTSLGNEEPDSGFGIDHLINLDSLDFDTLYYYKVGSCDVLNNCANSSVFDFTTDEEPIITDDLMVNYVRGQIKVNGVGVSAGTVYIIEVLTGANAGYNYARTVDSSLIPLELKGNGYYDTGDKIEFSTGDSFRIDVVAYDNCFVEGVFTNGGNGDFNTEIGLVNLECLVINNPPELESIGNKQVDENELLEFSISAIDFDNDTLNYYANDLPAGATFVGQLFSWTPNYIQGGIYEVNFNVTDGEDWDDETITITVGDMNQPPVLEDIENQVILEDTIGSVLVNAIDLDNDTLTYTIIDENVLEVDCDVNNNNVTFSPFLNWNGNASCEVSVSDGNSGIDSKIFYIEVQAVNDAPVLNFIEDIEVDEGDLVKIIPSATDVDEDDLYFYFSSPLNETGEWQTEFGDDGIYNVLVEVSDGGLTDDQEVRITVGDLNQPPVIEPIEYIEVEEDSGFTNNFDINVSDDGYVVSVEVVDEDNDEVDCTVSDLKLGVEPASDWYGVATCTIRATDDLDLTTDYTFDVIVTNINDAPVIDYSSPDWHAKIPEDGTQDFEIEWYDIDNEQVDVLVEWFVDGNPVPAMIAEEYTFEGNGTSKDYNIKVVVSDLEDSVFYEWDLTTSNIPLTEKYNGDTTNFTGMDDNDLECVDLILERTEYGKIEFLECVDMRDIVDLDKYTDIGNRLSGIDSNFYSDFKNRLAKLTFYNIDEESTPAIYYANLFTLNPSQVTQDCPGGICSEKDYDILDKIFEFLVESFSTFKVGDALTCSEQGGDICSSHEVCSGTLFDAVDSNSCCSAECSPDFSDIDVCEILSDDLIIKIKEPDDGDEFESGELIEGEIEIENNYYEDQDFDVEVYLYDLTEDEEIEDFEDDIDVDEGDEEDFEFELKIPDDVDEDNKYYIFVKVEDDICNQNYIEIEIEQKEHYVVIEDVNLYPEEVYPGEVVKVEIEVENLGTKDEDVYLVLENTELGILEQSEEFEVEEDDDKTETLWFSVPNDAEIKSYNLEVKVVFDDGEDIESVFFKVVSKTTSSGSSTSGGTNNIIYLGSLEDEGEGKSIVLKDKTKSDTVALGVGQDSGEYDYDPYLFNLDLSNPKSKKESGEGNLFLWLNRHIEDVEYKDEVSDKSWSISKTGLICVIILFIIAILATLILIIFMLRRTY